MMDEFDEMANSDSDSENSDTQNDYSSEEDNNIDNNIDISASDTSTDNENNSEMSSSESDYESSSDDNCDIHSANCNHNNDNESKTSQSPRLIGGGPKKKFMEWTPEVKKLLLECHDILENRVDEQNENYKQTDLYELFKSEIKKRNLKVNKIGTVKAVITQLKKFIGFKTERASQND